MKIVVFSDSHGYDYDMERLIRKHSDAYCFFHLGDGAPAFLTLCGRLGVIGHAVKGNCDLFTGEHDIRPTATVTLGRFSFFLTHGDRYGVNWSKENLVYAAKERGCNVAIYGHTHVAHQQYIPAADENDKPVYLFNPGSISRPRDGAPSYGIIDFEGDNILFNTVRQ